MLGTLYEEASSPATARLVSEGMAPARDCPSSNGCAVTATDVPAVSETTDSVAPGDREMVEALKRKLSMLTVGIRFLHNQIEEKSLQLLGTRDVEQISQCTPETRMEK